MNVAEKGKGKSSLWMESLSLAWCPEVSSTSFSWKVGSLQGDEVGSAMTEEVTSSNGSKQQKAEAVSFADWRSVEVKTGLDRLGSGLSVVLAANEDSDGGEDYSILDQGKRIGKHAHDEELDQHSNNEITTAINAGERQHIEGAPEPGPKVGPANSSSHLDNPAPPPLEHLFDKAVTPSDVGKLNRLVIPKQHAEKHFPMDVNYSDKGLLLNFEDNTGKAWRFRYSYWNSSQSYVLTKGWSRFVKDKKLEAGDIVSFHRGTPDTHQLYITWRRRPCGHQPVQTKEHATYFPLGALNPFHSARRVADYNPQWMHIYWPNSESPLGHLNAAVCPPQNPAIPLCLSAPVNRDLYLNIKRPGAVEGTAKKESPSTSSFDPATKAKEVRIFGVNLVEWQRLGVDELMLFPS